MLMDRLEILLQTVPVGEEHQQGREKFLRVLVGAYLTTWKVFSGMNLETGK